jgi:ribosomal protein L22
MTPPDDPATPAEGKPDEAKVEQEAAEAKAEVGKERAEEAAEAPEPEPDAAAASAEEKPKPKRRSRAKKSEPAEEAKDAAAAEDAESEAAEADGEPEPEDEKARPKTTARRRGGEAAAGRRSQPARTTRRDADPNVTVRARARYVRHAPRKARLVIDHIRGKDIDQARAILMNTPRAASRDVLKLLDSAIANAENNHDLVADDLKVGKAYVDEGPTLKRYRPRALGRATRIRKRTSHMTIELVSKG